jgi:hypothetical protein
MAVQLRQARLALVQTPALPGFGQPNQQAARQHGKGHHLQNRHGDHKSRHGKPPLAIRNSELFVYFQRLRSRSLIPNSEFRITH